MSSNRKRSAYSRAACSMNFFAPLSVSTSARTVSASRTISLVKRAMWSAASAESRGIAGSVRWRPSPWLFEASGRWIVLDVSFGERHCPNRL